MEAPYGGELVAVGFVVSAALKMVAAGAVFAGMVLSSVYAVMDFRGSDVLTIPQMARTHGILNAVGFCMTALLGWVIEFDGQILNRRER